jgi:Polyphosphate kinase 2 (PPK2)
VPHLPAVGSSVLFDRSWYSRAGVERVMGFCSADQLADFLREAPQFEGMPTRDGIHLFKFYLDIGRQQQLKRFHRRRHDPLRRWKITQIDLAAMAKWDDYTKAKEDMFRFTHTAASPWTVIRANDKRRTRLEAVGSVLCTLDYDGKGGAGCQARRADRRFASRSSLRHGPDLRGLSRPGRAHETGARRQSSCWRGQRILLVALAKSCQPTSARCRRGPSPRPVMRSSAAWFFF